jgi:hypothetical protein
MPTLALPKNNIMQAATKAALATFAALLLSLFVITTTGCKKPTDNPPTGNNNTPTPCDTCLPPITTHGAGTFGCKINGKPFVAKGSTMIPATQLDVLNKNVGIIGRDVSNKQVYYSVSFNIDPVIDNDVISFPNTFTQNSGASCIINSKQYNSFPIQYGIVRFLRTDYQRMIFSGTFEFDVYSVDRKDTIHITEGRFDLHH